MKEKTKKTLLKETVILLAVLFLGYLLIADGSKQWRYPLSARPEVKARILQLGWAVLILGYPVLAFVRFLSKKNRNKK